MNLTTGYPYWLINSGLPANRMPLCFLSIDSFYLFPFIGIKYKDNVKSFVFCTPSVFWAFYAVLGINV